LIRDSQPIFQEAVNPLRETKRLFSAKVVSLLDKARFPLLHCFLNELNFHLLFFSLLGKFSEKIIQKPFSAVCQELWDGAWCNVMDVNVDRNQRSPS